MQVESGQPENKATSSGRISSNVFAYSPNHVLDAIFSPRNIALIGATDKAGSIGRTLLWNLISNPFGGTLFPVNAKRSNVLGIKAYPNVAALPEKADLAVIATPATTVPGVIAECVAAGIKGAVIVSAGFKEAGEAGAELEQRILQEARKGGLRVVGPNCLGIMRPANGLNATISTQMARPGSVGFVSQSGALCSAVLDWSLRENVGFSAFVSVGGMVDVGWGDLIDYLGDDPYTKSIVIYMETIGDARSFLSAAREVALSKPIILINTGRTQAAALAAASHTGALTGSYEVFEAAFRRSGVISVNSIGELFYLAEVLAKQPRPKGPRLTILTNAGGPGVLATQTLTLGGGELAPLSEDSRAAFDKILPPFWSKRNPIDILGDADPARFAAAFEIAAKDPTTDGLLVILAPQAATNPTETAVQLKKYANLPGKPVLASWMGGAEVATGDIILNQAGIPTFPYPEVAAQIFNYMWRYNYNLKSLYETPVLPADADNDNPSRAQARKLIEAARAAGRTRLSEYESKQILQIYGIPTVATQVARTADEAVQLARQFGYPVVLKLYSHTITHKSDIGGVHLDLRGEAEVRTAFQAIEATMREHAAAEAFMGVAVQPMIKTDGYELILGSNLDPQFGPVLLFGSGGQLVEVYQDRALGLPPLNTTLARRMIEQTRVSKALKGIRGRPPVDLAALEQLMVRFSQLVAEQRWIKELDINPLLASSTQLIALDARVVLHETSVTREQLPRLAIRPYPAQYIKNWTMPPDVPVVIRPIRPEDEPLMVRFHETLSERSVYFRWLHLLQLSARVAHERLIRICFIDYDREIALVADCRDPETGQHQILGVSRLSKLRGINNEGEFAVLVNDQFQKRGIGTELLKELIAVGKAEKISRLVGDIHPENLGMQRVCRKLGFKLHYSFDEQLTKAELDL